MFNDIQKLMETFNNDVQDDEESSQDEDEKKKLTLKRFCRKFRALFKKDKEQEKRKKINLMDISERRREVFEEKLNGLSEPAKNIIDQLGANFKDLINNQI